MIFPDSPLVAFARLYANMSAGLHHPEENFPEIAFSYLFFTSFAMMAMMRDLPSLVRI
jgi:hypothetical protein